MRLGMRNNANRAGGKVLKGLERRREADAALYTMRWYWIRRSPTVQFTTPGGVQRLPHFWSGVLLRRWHAAGG
jgi:hypothetical protein